MSSLFSLAEALWMKLPASIRLGALGQAVKNPVRSILVRHDDIYDREYYETRRRDIRKSARAMARTLVDHLAPTDVLDVGCGTGELLSELGKLGVTGRGLEYSSVALEICRNEGLDVRRYDLEKPVSGSIEGADLVVSTEVAEHLPPSAADGYVHFLAGVTNRFLVFTAAPPGQGGVDHVNEQPLSYWIEKFEERGLRVDERWTRLLADEWETVPAVLPQYYWNLVVFGWPGT